ncbi:hypothetical protein [Faecalibaculum rodentium]|uniref:hypothetical protein n=1 Tax=Faecalibaculum rodentium TaxID=1702221 RepID=UPI002670B029|nr:hypothetical protein [Faecalibaculum rodentium]
MELNNLKPAKGSTHHDKRVGRGAGSGHGGYAIRSVISLSDWTGLLLISIVLPAVICPVIHRLVVKAGWVREGDLTLAGAKAAPATVAAGTEAGSKE